MQEVFRHWDTATVGLVNSLLEDAGIRTVIRNWDGCNITEIPIPAIYPNVCVMHEEDLARARESMGRGCPVALVDRVSPTDTLALRDRNIFTPWRPDGLKLQPELREPGVSCLWFLAQCEH